MEGSDKILARMIKPDWAKRWKNPKRREPNPSFVQEIEGDKSLEGYFTETDLRKFNEAGYGVYWFPNSPTTYPEGIPFLSGRYIDRFEYVYVDMDLKDGVYKTREEFLSILDGLAVRPYSVVSSGNGIHAYWKVTDLTRDTFINLQFRLIDLLKTDASVWTPHHVMRMPNTMNTKRYGDYTLVDYLEAHSTFQECTVADLDAFLPPITDKAQFKLENHIAVLEGRNQVNLSEVELVEDELPLKFQALMAESDHIRGLFEDPVETYGDRSGADAALCNILFNEAFSKDDALKVMYNTVKARERTSDRDGYASNLVEKVYKDRLTRVVESVEQYEKSTQDLPEEELMHGPEYWDGVLEQRWRKSQVLGLIAPTNGGKTAINLSTIKSFIDGAPTSTDLHFFFSLEMPASDIIKRWNRLTNNDPKYKSRFFVVAGEDKEGNPRHIGLQEVYNMVRETCLEFNAKPGSISIDHFGLLNKTFDLRVKPTFGAENEESLSRHKYLKTLPIRELCKRLKSLAKMLDCFVIVQSQTTKDKAGSGDLPLHTNSAYGAADFEWAVDFLITCWQPIIRVANQTKIKVTAWKYCKIREQSGQADAVQKGVTYLLRFNETVGNFRPLTEQEDAEVQEMIKRANALRAQEEKKQPTQYFNSPIRKLKLLLNKDERHA